MCVWGLRGGGGHVCIGVHVCVCSSCTLTVLLSIPPTSPPPTSQVVHAGVPGGSRPKWPADLH